MTTWRVTSWNILGSHEPDLARIADVLRELDPDVVALQEVRRHQARSLARALQWNRVWGRKHHPYSPLVWWRTEGHAILSRWPLAERRRSTLTPGTSTWIFRHRIVLTATVRRDADSLRLFDTHLASDDVDQRIAQARRVAAIVAADSHPQKVLAGDLNTTDDNIDDVLRELRTAGLVDPGGGPTEPAQRPRQRLDHVLVPGGATTCWTHVPDGDDGWRMLSDHLPVTVEIEVG